MKYKVTRKCVICTHLGCEEEDSVFHCLECDTGVKIEYELTETYTEEQYIGLLERGNVFITKVEIE